MVGSDRIRSLLGTLRLAALRPASCLMMLEGKDYIIEGSLEVKLPTIWTDEK